MRFALSDEQTQFASVLHDFLAAGHRDLSRIGVTDVTDPADLVVVFDELGDHAVPGPLIESIAVTPALGVSPGSIAFPPHMPYAVEASRYYLVEGTTLREALPGTPLSSVDPSRRLFELVGGDVIATGIPDVFDLGVLACAAQLLGLGRAMLELACSHARVRTQFGKPIGSFQAVKHQLADVLIGLELARPLVFGAAVTLATRDVSAAKVAAGDAAQRAARAALQVHGAIGYTAEHPLGQFLLRTRALVSAWGSQSLHRARVLEAL
ncbi:acyl-CoA dehydrogenase [Lentzea sp. NBRC 105346]|uniref:acyl-CoA dehydrogenase family protein n=1 Tax=Lentzea sp. NBRC 105346 TaxID=3032205 RepID=UPI0024A0BA98|nr:acyl-CoA dehydrogenase family protein [Lentzea sp. NBRC 105346]GLZ31759.1 acyl-CoA dehydrogenase [Lentzea sp. NBRC 105346]